MALSTFSKLDTLTSGAAPSTRRRRGMMRAALTLIGVLSLTAIATQVNSAPTAHAAGGFYYRNGYTVQHGWLCFGWSSGAYHCTRSFHYSLGRAISDNPSWVPNIGGAGGNPHAAPVSQSSVRGSTSAGEPCRSGYYFNGYPSQWQTPPSCYGGIYWVNPNNYVYRPGFGWCNWWPEVMQPNRPNLLWGNYARGSWPAPGATVVFAPGVQGAGGAGHYGRVVAVYPGGQWMLISEMNFFWRGGGFARVSYRYVHTGWGVSFIY